MQLCHSFMSPESAKFVMSYTTLPAITLNNNATNLFGTTFVFYLNRKRMAASANAGCHYACQSNGQQKNQQ